MRDSTHPGSTNLGDIPANAAIRDPDALALCFESSSWTFAQLADEVHRLRQGIRSLGSAGDRIAILAENLPEYVFAYYAVPAAGMTLAMLNYRLLPSELDALAEDCGARILLSERKYYDALRAGGFTARYETVVIIDGEVPGDDGVLGYRELLERGTSFDGTPHERSDDALAWIIYTSGTTGRPKGVMLSHENLAWAIANSLGARERGATGPALLPWPMCHVAGFLVPMTHICSRALVLMRSYDPAGFLELIEKHRVTEASMAPTMLNMLLRHPAIDDFDLSSLDRLSYGAAPMPLEVLKRALGRFGTVQFSTGFGMTELAGNVLYQPWSNLQRALEGEEWLLGSVGRAMPFGAVRVVDERLSDVAVDEVGELVVRAPQVMQGYWERPDATDEAFEGGWFHTGDLARVDVEGNVYIVDRKKDIIVTGGENVSSREVEEVIYGHSSVAEAAVVAQPDENWGEIIVAFVQLVDGAIPDAEAIVDHCRERLAGYKKPRRVVFVDELPRNPAGKILKRELRARLVDADPGQTGRQPA